MRSVVPFNPENEYWKPKILILPLCKSGRTPLKLAELPLIYIRVTNNRQQKCNAVTASEVTSDASPWEAEVSTEVGEVDSLHPVPEVKKNAD